jgi:lysine 6-dehydrogenase
MKVVVFGGAGNIGREAARILAESKDIEKLILADYDDEAAENIAGEVGAGSGVRIEAAFCDANDRETITVLMKEADVCLGCIGPFYQFEEKMIRAAIETKCDYVSICDDFDAAEAALKFDKSAKKAGITVLTGMGWTPGLSNVLARKAMEIVERASEIHIAWVADVEDSESVAFIKHNLHIFNGDVPVYTGGRWRKVPAGSGREKVGFPSPIGNVHVFHAGHPEPITIPHFLHDLDKVTLKGAIMPEWTSYLAIGLGKLGFSNTAKKRDAGAMFLNKIGPAFFKSKETASGILVRVVGEKNGSPAWAAASCVDNIKRLTGIPAAVGTLLVGGGEIEEKGVLAPEICVPTDLFLKEIKKRGLKVEMKTSWSTKKI